MVFEIVVTHDHCGELIYRKNLFWQQTVQDRETNERLRKRLRTEKKRTLRECLRMGRQKISTGTVREKQKRPI